MRKDGVSLKKSKEFAIRIVMMYKFLTAEKKEFVMSKQVLRSGTSIGANLREAAYAQSHADFYSKVSIALKETAETEYWLELLFETGYLDEKSAESIQKDCAELLKILTAICKSAQQAKDRA